MSGLTFENILVPIASESDAESTCEALVRHLPDEGGRVTVVHVIEKAGGAPDRAGVEQRRERAERIFARCEETLDGTVATLETEVLFGTDVAETILDHGRSLDATAIVFTPRGASRWVKLLTGSVAEDLLTGTDRPIVVLPADGNDE